MKAHSTQDKPSSFGVYLGEFSAPITEHQHRLLHQWDLLVVNPFQPGVINAISNLGTKQVLGRLDLDVIIPQENSTLTAIQKIEDALLNLFSGTYFHGILLANWDYKFSPAVGTKLVAAICNLGLVVYLETGPSNFTGKNKALRTSSTSISGLVIRNASILPCGEKRDYFQMMGMQPTIKGFVSEACKRDFNVMVWETIDDHAHLPNAVLRRSLQWCKFYNAICWIGNHSALYDATLNAKKPEPLSSFGWLKEPDIMKVHAYWRSNQSVSKTVVKTAAWNTLQSLFPSLKAVLGSTEWQEEKTGSLSIRLCDPPEWVAQIKSHEDPLSTSMSGERYNCCGCFPLGFEATHAAFTDILQSQQRLKALGLLHSLPTTEIQGIGFLLQQFFHDTSAPSQLVTSIKELSDRALNGSLHITLGLNSGLRKDANARFWAVYQMNSRGIEIFVSKNAQDLAETVLHTFLSAKGYPRHVCFEAEIALASWSEGLVRGTRLSRRLVQDIDALSPEERLLLLQHLTLANSTNELSKRICLYIRKQLLHAPSLVQLKELNTIGYLDGSVSPEYLVKARVNWYKEQGCQYPSDSECLALFNEVDAVFTRNLTEQREADLARLTSALCDLIKEGCIDAYVDMTMLSLFCASRKGAFDEIYMEVTDRNPLFSNQTDQAAAFAEAFALGWIMVMAIITTLVTTIGTIVTVLAILAVFSVVAVVRWVIMGFIATVVAVVSVFAVFAVFSVVAVVGWMLGWGFFSWVWLWVGHGQGIGYR